MAMASSVAAGAEQGARHGAAHDPVLLAIADAGGLEGLQGVARDRHAALQMADRRLEVAADHSAFDPARDRQLDAGAEHAIGAIEFGGGARGRRHLCR